MSLVKLARGGERLYKDGTGFLVEVGRGVTKRLTAAQFEKMQQAVELLL